MPKFVEMLTFVYVSLWVMSAITGLMYGTQYFQASDKPLYHSGLVTMIGVVSAGAGLVLIQEVIYWHWNRKVNLEKKGNLDNGKSEQLYIL